ncbi:MAG TPA: NADH-quinone oxidoreductase subunit J [Casimicrobiaceae bacterium]|nr:NADH-quinone oxidoreductase subunit J [Casimicrobiaceae bacterium]
MIETVLLWLFAATALAGAVLMLVLRHPMRVALALTATMISLGGVYGLLGVHVIAVFQILIYVGAVMVFMVYAIMLLELREGPARRSFSRLAIPGVAAAALFVAVFAYAAWHAPDNSLVTAGASPFGLKRFSVAFLNDYWLHFELVSVLLVAAVVAALAVLQAGRRRRG